MRTAKDHGPDNLELLAPVGARSRSLGRFVVRRLLWTIPVLVSVIVITFGLMHSVPGSPWNADSANAGLGVPLTDTAMQQLDAKYGLDEPWWEQLGLYLRNVVRFDFGDSYQHQGEEASDVILRTLPNTLQLGLIAIALVVPIGVAIGALAALRQDSPTDYAVSGLASVGASVPNFVVGILLILALSVGLNRATGGRFFLPATGFGLDRHLILPLITLGLAPVSFIARLTRSSILEALRQDHVRTAEAKGLTARAVVVRHVLKNSMVPVITTLGPLFTFLVTGTVVIESLFLIPGLGGTFVQAVSQRDYPVILGAAVVYTGLVVVGNLVVDLLYVAFDPRVRPA